MSLRMSPISLFRECVWVMNSHLFEPRIPRITRICNDDGIVDFEPWEPQMARIALMLGNNKAMDHQRWEPQMTRMARMLGNNKAMGHQRWDPRMPRMALMLGNNKAMAHQRWEPQMPRMARMLTGVTTGFTEPQAATDATDDKPDASFRGGVMCALPKVTSFCRSTCTPFHIRAIRRRLRLRGISGARRHTKSVKSVESVVRKTIRNEQDSCNPW